MLCTEGRGPAMPSGMLECFIQDKTSHVLLHERCSRSVSRQRDPTRDAEFLGIQPCSLSQCLSRAGKAGSSTQIHTSIPLQLLRRKKLPGKVLKNSHPQAGDHCQSHSLIFLVPPALYVHLFSLGSHCAPNGSWCCRDTLRILLHIMNLLFPLSIPNLRNRDNNYISFSFMETFPAVPVDFSSLKRKNEK